MRKKIKNITSIFLSLVMVLSIIIPTTKSYADTGREIPIKLTDFKITDSNNVSQSEYVVNTLFKLKYKWETANTGGNLREGDYFEMGLPEKFRFPNEPQYCNFDIEGLNGDIMAKAVITPGENGGGRLRATFTNYVNNKQNVDGYMHITSRWNEPQFPITAKTTETIESYGLNQTITLKPYVPVNYQREVLYKVSGQTLTADGLTRWRMRINAKQTNLHNVVITDPLKVEDPGNPKGIEFVKNNFYMTELKWENNNFVEKNRKNVSDRIQLSADKKHLCIF